MCVLQEPPSFALRSQFTLPPTPCPTPCPGSQMLTNNRIWKNRTVDIGVVTAEDALNYGFR